jgi:hypothetical protein
LFALVRGVNKELGDLTVHRLLGVAFVALVLFLGVAKAQSCPPCNGMEAYVAAFEFHSWVDGTTPTTGCISSGEPCYEEAYYFVHWECITYEFTDPCSDCSVNVNLIPKKVRVDTTCYQGQCLPTGVSTTVDFFDPGDTVETGACG